MMRSTRHRVNRSCGHSYGTWVCPTVVRQAWLLLALLLLSLGPILLHSFANGFALSGRHRAPLAFAGRALRGTFRLLRPPTSGRESPGRSSSKPRKRPFYLRDLFSKFSDSCFRARSGERLHVDRHPEMIAGKTAILCNYRFLLPASTLRSRSSRRSHVVRGGEGKFALLP
jgi:hypothetical protein